MLIFLSIMYTMVAAGCSVSMYTMFRNDKKVNRPRGKFTLLFILPAIWPFFMTVIWIFSKYEIFPTDTTNNKVINEELIEKIREKLADS